MSALPSMEATRAHMDTLMKERDRIEKSILMAMKEHESLGVRLNEPLLDAQGYPRPELDLYRIRSLRNSIASMLLAHALVRIVTFSLGQQNDLKTVMQKIENLLPQALPADNSSVNCQSIANRRPFARVGVVPSESFAFGVVSCRMLPSNSDLIYCF